MSQTKLLAVAGVAAALGAYFFALRARPAPMPPALVGMWDSGCRKAGLGHAAPWRVLLDFKPPDREVVYYSLFQDAACQVPVSTDRYVAHMKFVKRKRSGEFDVDSVNASFSTAIHDQATLVRAQKERFYGSADWTLNKPRDTTGRSIKAQAPILAAGSQQFDMLKLVSSSLVFGDNASGDGTTPATRPTAFEEGRAYRRLATLPDYARRAAGE